ncbi:MAG: hypothetical protein K8L91_01665 [Anaerolineae bacterium]|nr:hypothetical protein [Anaerolineae bacterium]
MAYSVAQKAAAVAIANRHTGKLSSQALAEIRQLRGLKKVAKNTVALWLEEAAGLPSGNEQNSLKTDPKKKTKSTPLTPAIIEAAEGKLDALLEQITRLAIAKVLRSLTSEEMKGKDAATIMAIAIDKMRLVQGLPTHILGTVQEIDELAKAKGMDSGKILQFIRDDLKAV